MADGEYLHYLPWSLVNEAGEQFTPTEAREQGRYLGIGFGCGVELSGVASELMVPMATPAVFLFERFVIEFALQLLVVLGMAVEAGLIFVFLFGPCKNIFPTFLLTRDF